MMHTSGSIRLSTVIMAHPERADRAHALAQSLPELRPRVLIDPTPNGTTLRMARQTWGAYAADATHHLVLQDDVIPCTGFVKLLHEAVTDLPYCALSFFASWSERTANVIRIAAITGRRWAEVSGYYVPCLALVMPVDVAQSFSAATTPITDGNGRPIGDDLALFDHIQHTRTPAYVHLPNLLQHSEIPSVAGNLTGRRLSSCYDDSPDELGVGKGVTEGLTIVPHFSWSRGRNDWLARHSTDQRRWFQVPDNEVLSLHGVSRLAVAREYDSAVSLLDSAVVDKVGIWLRDLWRTAVATGMAAARDPYTDTTTNIAHETLSTMAPGAWRRLLPDTVMDDINDAITQFVLTAVNLGIAWVAQGRCAALGDVTLPKAWFGPENLPPHRSAP